MANSRVCILVDLPPEPLWELLSDFRGWDKWHKGFPGGSRMEDGISDGPCAPGVIRSVGEADALVIRIKWLACDEDRLEIAFTSLPPYPGGHLPFGARGFKVSVKLVPLTGTEQTVVEWTSQFDADHADATGTRNYLEGSHPDEADTRNWLEQVHRQYIGYLEEGARSRLPTTKTRNLEKAFELRIQP